MTDNEIREKIYSLSEKGLNSEAERELRGLIQPGSIGLAQINPGSCDIENNAKKVVKYIRHAQNIGLDLVVFPELVLLGFPADDTTDRHPILVDENVKWLNQIAKITTGTTALVGFAEPVKDKKGKYYSSVAVLSGGKIQDIIRNSVSPEASEFNDYRYIEPFNNEVKTITVNGKKYGIAVGSGDLDSISKVMKDKPDVLINCAASSMNMKTEYLRSNILSSVSGKYSTPVIYVNQVGTIDGTTFAGVSRVYDKGGKLFARARAFEEQLLIVNHDENIGKIYPIPENMEMPPNSAASFSLDYKSDMERTYKAIIQGIRDYFGKTGFKRAVLGLSGGLDSTVCAVLLADALGKENVFGVSMPSKITTEASKSDAEQLANNLGIGFAVAPIKDMVDTTSLGLNVLFEKVEGRWDCRYKQSYTLDNIQARSRAVILWGVSNEFESCLPIATSDKSEAYMGYATINGDMSGGFAPIADVTKTKLFALARWLNKNREEKNAIPESVILKRPGAELAIDSKTGKPLCAEDALMPYEFLDEVIWHIENKKASYNDMLNTKFLYEKNHELSHEQKVQWLDKFYRRMAGAMYKWSISAPSVSIDKRFIGSNEYRQPITSSHLDYKGKTEEEIEKLLS